ncbi:F-box protein At2g17036-like isoform X1 [Euphorbia lathyris]|uniref:F-box protein At2g17036-like isoform X1 n=1 Tax=Euphorbia lathyris TaxID=212925 RepID=UPI003314435E
MDMCINRREEQLKCFDGDENEVDWAGLPDVLLMKIVERLSLIDSVSFSNVCVSFRCAAAELFSDKRSSSALPWLVMSGENHTKIRTCFSILERKVIYLEMPNSCGRYIWGSFEHWLVMVTPSNTGNEKHQISLLNPFLGNEVTLPNTIRRFFYSQLVASGSPYDPSTVYMLVGSLGTDLAFWTQGCKDWCEYERNVYARICEGVFCNGYFYILEGRGCNIRQIEVKSALCALRRDGTTADMRSKYYQLGKPDIGSLGGVYWISYLVESCGEVLFIARLFNIDAQNHITTYKFKVYRLDLCKLAWISVDDLGDRVLFVGHKCSRSASAKEMGVEMGNCIFFTNEYPCVQGQNEWSNFRAYTDKRVKGSNIEEWGCYRLGSENIFYPAIQTNWNSTWISAPLSWYIRV